MIPEERSACITSLKRPSVVPGRGFTREPGTYEHQLSRARTNLNAIEGNADVHGFRAYPSGASRNDYLRCKVVPYYVYLLASRKHGTLYLGMTKDLVRRVYEHKNKAVPGFSARYGVDRLVWFECYEDPISAITREKEIKKWRRDWKIRLIETDNPDWLDRYDEIAR